MYYIPPMKQVERERGKKYVGVPEFAQAAERILTSLNLEQERGTVTSVPDERTIRYYLAEGLIQPPEEKQGTALVFGHLHLLQLIAVKKLQAEHIPIRHIRELVAGKSEAELESLIGVGSPTGKKRSHNEASRYLEALLPTAFSETGVRRVDSAPGLMDQVRPARSRSATGTTKHSWERVELEPGLELHIRSDYEPPVTSARSRNLAERIRSVISKYWRKE